MQNAEGKGGFGRAAEPGDCPIHMGALPYCYRASAVAPPLGHGTSNAEWQRSPGALEQALAGTVARQLGRASPQCEHDNLTPRPLTRFPAAPPYRQRSDCEDCLCSRKS
jgi:hypothetical protein